MESISSWAGTPKGILAIMITGEVKGIIDIQNASEVSGFLIHFEQQ